MLVADVAGRAAPGVRLEVAVLNPNRYSDVETARLRGWLRQLVSSLSPEADSFAVRLVGDRAMRALNGGFREREGTTDVLSFPGEVTPEGSHLGDLAVSVPVARKQAAERGHSLNRELRCLLLHGLLHCLGHDHETDAGEMGRLELHLRARWVDGPEGRDE